MSIIKVFSLNEKHGFAILFESINKSDSKKDNEIVTKIITGIMFTEIEPSKADVEKRLKKIEEELSL